MKLITRETDYAARALIHMAEYKRKVVSVTELVNSLKIPRPFLRKILQVLNSKGLLHSYKGKGGGFILAKPANKIFLVDLIRIFQGPIKLNECMMKKRICSNRDSCILRSKIGEVENQVISRVKNITIASLLRG